MTDYAGNASGTGVPHTTIPLVDDSMPPTAMYFNPALEALADNDAYRAAGLAALNANRKLVLVATYVTSGSDSVTVNDNVTHTLCKCTFPQFTILPTDILIAIGSVNVYSAVASNVAHLFDIQAVNASSGTLTLNTTKPEVPSTATFLASVFHVITGLSYPNMVEIDLLVRAVSTPGNSETMSGVNLVFMVLR